MAWNEPGGNKPKDPWGGGEQGPPDLDEAIKKVQEKLGSLFGGRPSSSGGGNAVGAGGGLLALILVAALIFWAAMGFYKVDEQERGVIFRLGRYHATVGAVPRSRSRSP